MKLKTYFDSIEDIRKYCFDVELVHIMSDDIAKIISESIFEVMHSPQAYYTEDGFKRREGVFLFDRFGVMLNVKWIWTNGLTSNPKTEFLRDSAKLDFDDTRNTLTVHVKSVNGTADIGHVEGKIRRALIPLFGIGFEFTYQIDESSVESSEKTLTDFRPYDDLNVETAEANIIYLISRYNWVESVKDCMGYLFDRIEKEKHYIRRYLFDLFKDTDIFKKYFLLKCCRDKIMSEACSMKAVYFLQICDSILKRLGFVMGKIYYKVMHKDDDEMHEIYYERPRMEYEERLAIEKYYTGEIWDINDFNYLTV